MVTLSRCELTMEGQLVREGGGTGRSVVISARAWSSRVWLVGWIGQSRLRQYASIDQVRAAIIVSTPSPEIAPEARRGGTARSIPRGRGFV